MLDKVWLSMTVKEVIDRVQDSNISEKYYISTLYNTMLYINQLFGQEMERWLLENHYKVEGQK